MTPFLPQFSELCAKLCNPFQVDEFQPRNMLSLLNRLESIELMCLTRFEALFENFVVDKLIVYLRDVICVTRSQK